MKITKIMCNIFFGLILVLILLIGWQLNSIHATYEAGQMVQLKMGGTGMIIGRELGGYLVRVGTEEVWFKEFELEEL